MTTIYCRCKACLSNVKGRCTANAMQLDNDRKCKDFVQYDSLISRHAVFHREKRKLKNQKRNVLK